MAKSEEVRLEMHGKNKEPRKAGCERLDLR